ncbi:condensation domain-containing protein [Acetivibrio cellulolyticus]|uniref:condensation domain-containing protein n=1 Tax=Acetivibrio cellulolyticus TaxID=35830 RepID=UPI0001E2DE18|nr:condensation domain-containing protein [Acetivibrio cellulolyticus]
MDVKTKIGNNKRKFSYEDFWERFRGSENPFEAMFSKSSLDYYYKFYENMSKSMFGYYKELNKAFVGYWDTNEHEIGKIPDEPDVLPVNGHDIYNYVARHGMGNFHSQAILNLDGRLDFDKLSKAVRLSVDAEPVLGCRFIKGNPPYWKRMENIDDVEFCSFEEVSDVNEAVKRFLDSRLDMDDDPKIKIKLIRSESYDVLGFKANHACCDGSSFKDYIQLLSDIYSEIDRSDGAYIPKPANRGRSDQDLLFNNLGIKVPNDLWIPGSDVFRPTWAFPWKQGTSSNTRVVTCKIPPDQLDRISIYAKSKGATYNDLILTAYYRAMLRMGQPVYGVPMGINVTIDLRRYLPNKKTEAIRNFSGSVNASLSMVKDETFSDTLSRVVYMMNEIKSGCPGLQSAIGLERLEKISFKEVLAYYQASSKTDKDMPNVFYGNRCIPTLSNLGILSKSLIKFGNIAATDYFIVPPVVSAPGLLLAVNTYNNVMTMAMGFFENTVLSSDVERLLNNIRHELLEGCNANM